MLPITIFWIAAVAVVAVAVHAVLRKYFPTEQLRAHHEVTSAIYAMFGVLHGLIFGYLVVTGQERVDNARLAIVQEVALLQDLNHLARALPQEQGQRLLASTISYAKYETDSGRKAMEFRSHDAHSKPLRALWNDVLLMKGTTPQDLVIQQASIRVIDDLFDARERRIHLVSERHGPMMLTVVFIGAATLICGLFLFAHRSAAIQLSLTALVALTVSMVVALILALDAPLASGLISVDAFESLVK